MMASMRLKVKPGMVMVHSLLQLGILHNTNYVVRPHTVCKFKFKYILIKFCKVQLDFNVIYAIIVYDD